MSFNDVVLLRPLVVTRFANATPGAAVLVMGVALAAAAAAPLALSLPGWTIATFGVVLMVRGFRAGVRMDRDSVRVYGYLWTRTIPRRCTFDVTTFPAIRWTGRSGRSRWTPMLMFMTSTRALGFINAHHKHCQRIIKRELTSGPAASP